MPLNLTSREVTFLPQGRYTDTYQFNDSGSFMAGRHEFQFGGSLQAIRINPYNYAGQYPTVSTGFSPGVAPSNLQLVASMFPAASARRTSPARTRCWRSSLASSRR